MIPQEHYCSTQLLKNLKLPMIERVSEHIIHADPCPPPKASKMGMWASEPDHGAMEEDGLV